MLRGRVGAVAAVLLGAAVLIWPAYLNRYPLVFNDTFAYLLQAMRGEAPWDKTVAYGPFLTLFHRHTTLWLPLLPQGLILSHLLWLTQRVTLGSVGPLRHLLLVIGLAALTSAQWFAATLMPDVLTPVVVLSLYLLGCIGEARLGRLEAAWLTFLAAFAIAAHLSHLPTALALLVVLPLLRRSWRPIPRLALPIAAAMLFLTGANWVAFGRPTLSANGSVFLLARLQQDGPATWTLRQLCPSVGWHMCGFLDRLPMDSDVFIWDGTSPPSRDANGEWRANGHARLAPEAREIVAATLREHPIAVARTAVANAWDQLFRWRVGDTLEFPELRIVPTWEAWPAFPPAELARYEASVQGPGDLRALAAPVLALHGPVLVVSLLVLVVAALRGGRGGGARRYGLVACVLVALGANAFTCGALSRPHDRYQARIVWLLPLAAALATLQMRRRKVA
jgi:hypothetical protein